MGWEDIIKAELYHPIDREFDGIMDKITFENGFGQTMEDDIILHIRYRDWTSQPEFNTQLYEIHIGIHPDLQGKGIAEKMIVGAVLDKNIIMGGYPLFLNYGRVINDKVFSVVNKLKNNSMIYSKEIIDEDWDRDWETEDILP